MAVGGGRAGMRWMRELRRGVGNATRLNCSTVLSKKKKKKLFHRPSRLIRVAWAWAACCPLLLLFSLALSRDGNVSFAVVLGFPYVHHPPRPMPTGHSSAASACTP